MKKAFLVLVISVSFLLGNCIGSHSLNSIQSDTLEDSSESIQFEIVEMNESNMSLWAICNTWVSCSNLSEYDDSYYTLLSYESSENQLVEE